ncbi:MAG TPA: glycosyltransferase family 87 protein [Candidatus Sulfotelmatobacter sp.]|jgi:hypothetical protein|nr:glycosyltransferase family 87 protein [Candidatus Sulfotelmatobacter sp.]
MNSTATWWRFTRTEKIWIAVALAAFLAFGFLLEKRTALRHEPMTDIGVFCIASGAIWSGLNPYNIPDWHGWHYQYPPALAILFFPFIEPVPPELPVLAPGEKRTAANTPYGFHVSGGSYYGLHQDNLHFFITVAVWYLLSTLGILLSAHLLGCALEQKDWREPPPEQCPERRRWWLRRLVPILVCATSLGTDLSRGQADILMLVAIAAGIYLVGRRKNFQAGLWLAFPAAIKLVPPVLIVYPFLRRQWRMAFGVIAGLFIFLLVLPAATLGVQRTKELYQCWIEVLVKPALGKGTDTSRLTELTGMGNTDNQSILTALHSWAYFKNPAERPVTASPVERGTASAIGIGLSLVAFYFIGFRRSDSPHELEVIVGVLIALGLLVSPIIHNFYFLLMLPLVSALFDFGLSQRDKKVPALVFLLPIVFFFAVDILTRMPVIGDELRKWGVATASLLWLTAAGVIFLVRQKKARAASN